MQRGRHQHRVRAGVSSRSHVVPVAHAAAGDQLDVRETRSRIARQQSARSGPAPVPTRARSSTISGPVRRARTTRPAKPSASPCSSTPSHPPVASRRATARRSRSIENADRRRRTVARPLARRSADRAAAVSIADDRPEVRSRGRSRPSRLRAAEPRSSRTGVRRARPPDRPASRRSGPGRSRRGRRRTVRSPRCREQGVGDHDRVGRVGQPAPDRPVLAPAGRRRRGPPARPSRRARG